MSADLPLEATMKVPYLLNAAGTPQFPPRARTILRQLFAGEPLLTVVREHLQGMALPGPGDAVSAGKHLFWSGFPTPWGWGLRENEAGTAPLTPPSVWADYVAAGLVSFANDTGCPDTSVQASQVLFEDDTVALIAVLDTDWDRSYKLLVDKVTGAVLTTEFAQWQVQATRPQPVDVCA